MDRGDLMKHIIELPRRVKIGGHTYQILTDEKAQERLRSSVQYGHHTEGSREIRLSTDFGGGQLSETFLHEALHAINSVYRDGDLGEAQIAPLSEGLWQVFEQLGIEFVPKIR